MGLGLHDLDGLPAGVSSAHPNFWDEQVECPACDKTTVVADRCERCDAGLDDDAIRDQLGEA